MGVAEAVKFGDVEREVNVAEGGASVVDVRQVGGGREGVGSGGGTGGELVRMAIKLVTTPPGGLPQFLLLYSTALSFTYQVHTARVHTLYTHYSTVL
jgi:hypothetical protein